MMNRKFKIRDLVWPVVCAALLVGAGGLWRSNIRLSRQDEIASCMRGGAIVCRNRVFASDEMYE